MTVFTEIRSACASVAAQASFVRINERQLQPYAQRLIGSVPESPCYDTVHHYLADKDSTLAYILMLDSINFGSGYFPFLKKRSGMSGYFTIASQLKDYFEERGTPTARQLRQLNLEQCASIFEQPLDHALQRELMQLFCEALNSLGDFVLRQFAGRYEGVIEASYRSAARLVTLLAEMPFFRDVYKYQALVVPLYKRAQITASDLALAFEGQGYGQFDDLDELTIFADNLVPHVLQQDGVLDYQPELLEAIRSGELPAGSPMEIELRAVSVHAVECLVTSLGQQGGGISARELDMLLWNRGQAEHYRKAPRHRTRTVYY